MLAQIDPGLEYGHIEAKRFDDPCVNASKAGCVLTMVTLSEFHMGKYRHDGYRENAPHFIRIAL